MQCESMKFSYAPGTPALNLAVPVDFTPLAKGETGETTGHGMNAMLKLSRRKGGVNLQQAR